MTWEFLAGGRAAPIDGVLTWLIQSTVLLAAGLTAGRLLKGRGPAGQSALYRTILVAVLACPAASTAIAAMGFPGLTIRVPSVAADDEDEPAGRRNPAETPAAFDPRAVAPSFVASPRVVAAATTPEPAGPASGRDRMALAMLVLWPLGTAILAARLLVGHRRMAHLRGTAVTAEPEAQALCLELAGRMRLELPRVLRSPFLSSPCLDGLRRPAILLPEEAEPHLRETFVHELAHLGRRDALWNLLRQLATAALWVQPLLWVLSRRIEETAEEVCDDFVVAFGADRGRYAGHLLELAGRRLPPPAPSAVGMISLRSLLGRRVARILDSTRSLSTRAGRRTLAATILAGLAGTILAGLLGVGGGGRNLLADEPESGTSAAGKGGETSGRPAVVEDDRDKAAPRDVPVTGRIVDLEGRPVRGVRVRVDSANGPKEGDLTPWIEAMRRGEPSWVAYRLLEEDKEKPSVQAETDAQGRFRLDGLAAERLFSLSIEGPSVAHSLLHVVTRRLEPFSAKGFTNGYGPGTNTIYGADFTLSAAPGRVVEGIVRDEKTNEAMKDVEVSSLRFAGADIGGVRSLKTRTDAGGRFRLAGFPKGNGNKLLVVPNDDQPCFMQDVDVADPPGIGAVPVEIGLHRGIWIEGRITDRETGAPVAGAWLHYLPFLENQFVRATPEFAGGLYRAGLSYQDRYQSRADGSFRLVGQPGRAIVGAVVYRGKPYRRGAGAESIQGMDQNGHFATVHNPVTANRLFPTSMKEINPAAGVETAHVDIALDPGATVRLRAVDQQGRPVAGVRTGGRLGRDRFDDEAQARAEFDVVTLGPGEERLILLVHEARKLGRVVSVRAGDDKDGPVEVVLHPSAAITGRIVDRDGNPVAGASIHCYPKEPTGDFRIELPELGSGPDGRFTLADVPTGCGYSLVAEGGSLAIEASERGFAEMDLAVRPGETTDLGEIALGRRQ